MANSSNNKDHIDKNKKTTSSGKITVSRETSGSGAKRSSTSKSSTAKSSAGSKNGTKSSANGVKNSSNGTKSSANGTKITVSRSSSDRSVSGSNANRSSADRKPNGTKSNSVKSNPAKSNVNKSSAAKSRPDGTYTKNTIGTGKKAQKQQKAKKLIVAAELIGILLFVVAGVSIYMKKSGKGLAVDTITEKDFQSVGIKVDGIDVSLMTKEQAKQALMNLHPWSLTVSFEDQRYEVDNYYEKEIDSVLYDAFASRADAEYTIQLSNPESIASTVAKTVSDMWSQPAVDATITGYDAESGEFILSASQPGCVIDVEKLSDDIAKELAVGNYTANVVAEGKSSKPNFEKEDYKVLATYKTTTTSNENRNTNVRLACETICGTILQPQEQFSYNTILGRRTAEKGYKEAGAYANGEHVMEIGGGICQVSSTIYNATVFSGLQIDQRTGHTYEPSYVTPGEDAAVSYSTPDFVFTNNSGATLGIKTTFKDRTIVATIFGVQILPEGVTQYMRSEKIGDIEPPPDVIVQDVKVIPGQALPVSGPKNGSKWATYIIQEKDGEIIKEEYYHTTTYRGTPGEIHVNETGIYDPTGGAAPQPTPQPTPQPEQPAEQPAQQPAEEQPAQ